MIRSALYVGKLTPLVRLDTVVSEHPIAAEAGTRTGGVTALEVLVSSTPPGMVAALGINVDRVFTPTFALRAGLAGVAGALMVPSEDSTQRWAATCSGSPSSSPSAGWVSSRAPSSPGFAIGAVQSLVALAWPAPSVVVIFAGTAKDHAGARRLALLLVAATIPGGLAGVLFDKLTHGRLRLRSTRGESAATD
jgi:hypothetical protein